MKVRIPKISYADVRPDWAPVREFAHLVNAGSLIPSFIEPWLIKVLREAQERLPGEHTDLHDDVTMFVAQEAQHYRQHNAFNKCIRETYPEIIPYEQQIERELADMLETRSLKFKLAYAEGFESMGPIAARLWFEDYAPYLEGADAQAIALYKWHMAEEYEHREVCHRLFKTLYARTIVGKIFNGWFYRCYAFVVIVRHLLGFRTRAYHAMLAADRRRMSAQEVTQSELREKDLDTFLKKRTMRDVLTVFSPFYNPRNRPEPKGWRDYLTRFERDENLGTVRSLKAATTA